MISTFEILNEMTKRYTPTVGLKHSFTLSDINNEIIFTLRSNNIAQTFILDQDDLIKNSNEIVEEISTMWEAIK